MYPTQVYLILKSCLFVLQKHCKLKIVFNRSPKYLKHKISISIGSAIENFEHEYVGFMYNISKEEKNVINEVKDNIDNYHS